VLNSTRLGAKASILGIAWPIIVFAVVAIIGEIAMRR
jgi:hypothetical protein